MHYLLVSEIMRTLQTIDEKLTKIMTAIIKLQNSSQPTMDKDIPQYEQKVFKDEQTFEAFCDKLADEREFRVGFVSIFRYKSKIYNFIKLFLS